MADVFTIVAPNGISDYTTSLILPAQTTPYAYSESCSMGVVCSSATIGQDGDVQSAIQNQECSAAYYSAPSSGYNWVTATDECYPFGFSSLFMYNMRVTTGGTETSNSIARGWYEAISTIAFPGDQCLSGWTTACTTTITDADDSSTYPQVWCCPGGDWTCAASTGPSDYYSPQRLCRSLVTDADAQDLYAVYWPPTTVGTLGRPYWTATMQDQAADVAPTAFHVAFPLQYTSSSPGQQTQTMPSQTGSTGAGAGATGSTDSTTGISGAGSNETPGAAGEQGNSQGGGERGTTLSTGAVAGVAVGVVVAVLGLLGIFIFLYRKRRLAAKLSSQQQTNNHFVDNKPELDGQSAAIGLTKSGSDDKGDDPKDDDDGQRNNHHSATWAPGAGGGFVAELPSDPINRHELGHPGNPRAEMEARERRAELRAEDVLPPEVDGTNTTTATTTRTPASSSSAAGIDDDFINKVGGDGDEVPLVNLSEWKKSQVQADHGDGTPESPVVPAKMNSRGRGVK